MKQLSTTILFALVASTTFAADQPPLEVFEQVAKAVNQLESEDFSGEFTRTQHMVVSKLNGQVKNDETVVERVTRRGGEATVTSIVSATRNGEDTTEEIARELREREQEKTGKKTEDEGKSVSVEVDLPDAESFANYRFGTPESLGNLLVSSFEPSPDSDAEEGAVRGRVAWNPETLEPAWMEITPLENPTMVKEMELRFEFAKIGEHIYAKRILTEAVGGLFFIKRAIVADMVVSDVVAY